MGSASIPEKRNTQENDEAQLFSESKKKTETTEKRDNAESADKVAAKW
jgi:hypothetical protein